MPTADPAPASSGAPAPGSSPASSGALASSGAPASSDAPAPGSSPATVTVRMFGSARAAAGTGEVEVAPGPMSQVLADLADCLPARFSDVLAVSSLVADGVRLDHGSPASIAGGTVLDVLPPFAGG